ncbi:RHS repeat-associated core domain-containing protein, partial [Ralstonia pseudosolanacearum]
YGRDRDGDDGKSDQPAETTGSLIYARNHLGSVTDTLTPNGRAVTHTEYGPYGELVKSQGRAEYRADFGYAGMQYHAASGMYLTLFRAYDSGTGRWVSRDPIGEQGGINLYAYVNGNPTSYIDPEGLSGDTPPLKRIHSDATLDSGSNRYSTDYWRNQPTDKIKASLKPGTEEPLRVKPDGRVVDGNTRIRVLQERGIDVNKLPRMRGAITIGACMQMAVGAILMSIPGNVGQCQDPCKCGEICKK